MSSFGRLKFQPSPYFSKIVEKINWKKLFKRLNLVDGRLKRDEIWFCCPFHSEDSASFSINKDNGAFKCFGCDTKGNLITLVAGLLKINNKKALEYLEELSGLVDYVMTVDEIKERIRMVTLTSRQDAYEIEATFVIEMPSTEKLTSDAKDYLTERGIDLDLAKARGFRFCKYGYFRDRLIIPIYDKSGEYCCFEARDIYGTKDKKVLYPKDSTMDSLIYNYFESVDYRSVILVEGIIDCVSLLSRGIKNVITCFGTSLTDRQKIIIARSWDLVYTLYDPDKAGRKVSKKIAEDLYGLTDIRVLGYASKLGDPKYLKTSFIRQLIRESSIKTDASQIDSTRARLNSMRTK